MENKQVEKLYDLFIDKNVEDLNLLEYLVAVVAYMEDYHWFIDDIVKEVPDKCNKIDNDRWRDIPFNTVYCRSQSYGLSPDLYHGDIYLPIPDTEYFLKLNFDA